MTNTNERFDEQFGITKDFWPHDGSAYEIADPKDLKTFISQEKELAIQEERQAWIDGKRCTSCGKAKEKDLADWCGECFENN